MLRGVLAAAAACVAYVPAAAAVHTTSATIFVPPGYDPLYDKNFGGTPLLDNPVSGLKAGDTIDFTISFSRPLEIHSIPTVSTLPIGYVWAGITSSGVPDRAPIGPATFEIDGTGFLPSGVAEFAPKWDSVAHIKIAQPGAFSGGTLNAIRLSYTVAADSDSVFTYAYFLTGIPEPASWAMMIGGFGLVGVMARAKRRERVGSPL